MDEDDGRTAFDKMFETDEAEADPSATEDAADKDVTPAPEEPEPEDAAADEDGTTPPAPERPTPPQMVPVSELVAERRKRQALEAQMRERGGRPAARPAQPPSLDDDPEGFIVWREQQIRQQMHHEMAEAHRYTASETRAYHRHGVEVVDTAVEAATEAMEAGDQALAVRIAQAADPVEEAVAWQREHALAQEHESGSLAEAYAALKAENERLKGGGGAQPAPAKPKAPATDVPPSLAAQPGSRDQSAKSGWEELFDQ